MHRNATLAALTAALSLALTACGGTEPESAATPEAAPTGRASLERTAPPTPIALPFPEAADGEDYGACYDGDCEVLVTEGVVIELDDEFRTGALTVASIDEYVNVVSNGGGAFISFNLGPGNVGNMNNVLNIETRAIDGDRAVIRLYPGEYEG